MYEIATTSDRIQMQDRHERNAKYVNFYIKKRLGFGDL